MPTGLELGDLGALVSRTHTGEDLVDAELVRDRLRHGLGVTRDHDDADAATVQGVDRLAGLGPDLVGQGERAEDHGAARGPAG
ncbi:hypothetical protein D3C74_381770 [compost metagenome]